MLPPQHLYSAAIINKHQQPQEVIVKYVTDSQPEIIEKQIIQPESHVVFEQKTYTHPDSSTHTYHIEQIQVPNQHELKWPFVQGPTKQKAFELIGDDEGAVRLQESAELRVWQ